MYNIDPEARFHQVKKWKEKEKDGFNEIINSVEWLRWLTLVSMLDRKG